MTRLTGLVVLCLQAIAVLAMAFGLYEAPYLVTSCPTYFCEPLSVDPPHQMHPFFIRLIPRNHDTSMFVAGTNAAEYCHRSFSFNLTAEGGACTTNGECDSAALAVMVAGCQESPCCYYAHSSDPDQLVCSPREEFEDGIFEDHSCPAAVDAFDVLQRRGHCPDISITTMQCNTAVFVRCVVYALILATSWFWTRRAARIERKWTTDRFVDRLRISHPTATMDPLDGQDEDPVQAPGHVGTSFGRLPMHRSIQRGGRVHMGPAQ